MLWGGTETNCHVHNTLAPLHEHGPSASSPDQEEAEVSVGHTDMGKQLASAGMVRCSDIYLPMM